MRTQTRPHLFRLTVGLLVAGVLAASWAGASAQPALTVQTITWNVVGLDSNNVNVGPSNFPVGARVCNTGTSDATNVVADFVWDSGDPYLDLRAGSQDPISVGSLTAGACIDVYFEVVVTRNAAAYNHTRRYHIAVTSDQTGAVSTPTPRELFIEHLVSQSRNSTTEVRLDGLSIPAGGTMVLTVGNNYTIELLGQTATNGYEQIETFINLPNTVFRVNAVTTTYTADAGTDSLAAQKLYADGCLWVNDPNAPNYRSCSATGKYGGNIHVTYNVTIVGGAGTSQTLNTLIYDFSGSSYHYNADFSTSGRIVTVLDPASIILAKSFVPDPTTVGGISTLTFTITNPNAAAVSGLSFTDVLPISPGAMVVASPPNASTSGCGTPTFAPAAGSGSLTFSGGSVAANSICTIKVNVTAPVAGTYTNTSGHLFVGSVDTGNVASDSLVVNSTPPPPACVPGLLMARWTFATGFNTSSPAPSTNNVTTVSASPGAGVTPYASSFDHTGGTSASWGSDGSIATGATLDTANNDYFEFALNTTGYPTVYLDFWAQRRSSNGPTGLAVYYGTSPTPPGGSAFNNSNAIPSLNAWTHIGDGSTTIAFTSGLNASGLTYFRIYGFNAGNTVSGSDLLLDDVTFTGCGTPNPPTLTKSFSPNPVAVGAASTLTFSLTNPNSLIALSGVAFSDTLPVGLTVASGTSAQCGGTLTATAPDGLSFSGGSLAAGASCTVSISVTAATAGPHANVSGFISSTQSGSNTGSSGIASATLTAVLPPSIAKQFAPNPILAGGVSTLTFTLTNPNPNNALSGVAFSDPFPALMVVASPTGAATSGCGSPTYAPVAGAGSIVFSGGSLAAAGMCTVVVNVTVPSAGTYANTSGNVSHVINAATVNGNIASDNLTASPPSPAIGLLKQVGASASGSWLSFLPVATGGDVYYRFTIENLGDVALSPVSVSDPDVSTSGCTWPVSLPVATASNDDHIATCVVGPISAVSGSHPNTATATGTHSGTSYTDTSTARYATTGLTLAKTVAEAFYQDAGDVLHYSYLVTNNGFAPLAGPVTVSDDQSTDESCPAVTTVGDADDFLDPGETITCTATYTATAGDVSAGSITNTASGTAGGVTSGPDSETVYLAALTIDKDTTTPNAAAGGTAGYTLTVVNAGGLSLTGVVVSDALPAGFTFASAGTIVETGVGTTRTSTSDPAAGSGTPSWGTWTIAAGGSITIPFSVDIAISVPDGTYDNTANVVSTQVPGPTDDDGTVAQDSGTPPGMDPEDDEDVTVAPETPALTIVKTATPATYDSVGDVIAYSFEVTNSGNVTLSGPFTVSDDQATDESCPATVSLAPAASITCSASYTITQADLDAGSVTNLAAASGSFGGSPVISPTDSETVTAVQSPALTIVKTATPATYDSVGDVIGYSFEVTNSGNVTLSGPFTVSDDQATDESCPAVGSLAPGASITCSATYTITQADLDAGSVTNLAAAGGSFGGGPVTSPTDTEAVAAVQASAFNVTKTESSTGPYAVGDTITYSLVVANTGNVTLTNVTVSDPDATVGTCTPAQPSSLAPLASMTCPASYVVTQTDVDSGSFTNTATADSVETPTDSDSETVTFTQAPALTIVKTATPATYDSVGDVITYSFLVTNSGNVTLSGPFTVSDDQATDESCPATVSLGPGASITCTASHTITQGDLDSGSVTNVASATNGTATSPTDTETVTAVQGPALTIVKTATPATYDSVGDVIGYSFLVTNSGNVTLGGPFTVSDDQATDESCPVTASLAPGASITCNASYSITQGDLNAGSVTNVASAGNGTVTSPTDTETVTAVQGPALTLVKSITAGTPYDNVGDVLSYSFVVTNTGNVSLAGPVTVADNRATDESCPAVTTVGNLDGKLDPGESLTCTASYTVTQGDLNNGSVTNTASATADSTTSNTDSETASAVSIVDPAVTKSGDPSTASIGETIVFTIVITNNGSIDATNVRIVDVVPAFLTITNVSASPPATTDTSTGNTVDLTFATVASTDVYTVTITTIVNSSASPPGGSNIVDLTADDDDDPSNNSDLAPITIVIGALGVPETGFAPGRLTVLPPQSEEDAYDAYGDLWLEIPKLALETTIVGVPQSGDSWDVSWLGQAAGYLNGTAFPTWAGNSVITAHVTLPSGLAGPFADLKSLRFGDRVIVHGWGQRYIYEIRSVDLVSPAERSVFRHEERSWLTLVTCHGYDEREAAYRWRVVARAVLIEVQAESPPSGPDERS